MKFIKEQYFTDKNYVGLYAHNVFGSMSASIMYMLTGAYFLNLGLPLYLVILFFGLEFGLRGTLCPIGVKVLDRLGVVKALSLGSLFRVFFFIAIVFAGSNISLIFCALTFYAIGGAILNPFRDIMEVVYVKHDHNRGKQMSFTFVINALFSAFSVVLGAYLLAQFGYVFLATFTSVILILSVLPFYFMEGEDIKLKDYKVMDGYKFVASDDFKDLIKPLFAEQLRITMAVVLMPLFLFTVIGDIEKYSYLAAAALVLEMVVTLFMGRRTDSRGVAHALERSFYLNAAAVLFLITSVTNPLTAFIGDSMNKISNSSYMSVVRAGMHLLIRGRRKGNLLLFGSGYQMMLCWGECVSIAFLALLAYFIGEYVFYVGFVLGAWGVFISWRFFKGKENDKKALLNESAIIEVEKSSI